FDTTHLSQEKPRLKESRLSRNNLAPLPDHCVKKIQLPTGPVCQGVKKSMSLPSNSLRTGNSLSPLIFTKNPESLLVFFPTRPETRAPEDDARSPGHPKSEGRTEHNRRPYVLPEKV
ncbi:unnamed protein product, partial [Ranitomeya imitator]